MIGIKKSSLQFREKHDIFMQEADVLFIISKQSRNYFINFLSRTLCKFIFWYKNGCSFFFIGIIEKNGFDLVTTFEPQHAPISVGGGAAFGYQNH